MKILVACEFSGVVRDAFRALGHHAISCDTEPGEGSGPHLRCDVREVVGLGWDMLIAHPPCTYLCSSGLHWNTRGRLVDGRPRAELTEEALAFFQQLWNAPIPKKAFENPIGCLSTRFRKPTQIIQPYWFGEDASKATCLWLEGLEPLRPTNMVPPRIVDGKKRWANQTDSGQNRLAPSENRSAERSRTYQGIADAMAAQWGGRVVPAVALAA